MVCLDPVSSPSVRASILSMQSGYLVLNSARDLTVTAIASYMVVDLLGAAVEMSLLKS